MGTFTRFGRRSVPVLLSLGAVALLIMTPNSAQAASPDAAADSSKVYIVAYAGSNDDLMYYDGTTGLHNTGIPIGYGSSPSAAFDNADYEIAFEYGNDGTLAIYDANTKKLIKTGLQMEEGTSPSISTNDIVAFQGYNGHLWYWDGKGHDTGVAMDACCESPSISQFNEPEGNPYGHKIALKNGSNHLAIYDLSTKKATDTGLGMDGFTSPSIGQSADGTCCTVAFEAASHVLWYVQLGHSAVNTGQKMETDTSPTIDRFSGSGVISYAGTNRALNFYDYLHKKNTPTSKVIAAGLAPEFGPLFSSSSGFITGYQAWYVATSSHALSYYNYSTKASGTTSGTAETASTFVSYTPGVRLAG